MPSVRSPTVLRLVSAYRGISKPNQTTAAFPCEPPAPAPRQRSSATIGSGSSRTPQQPGKVRGLLVWRLRNVSVGSALRPPICRTPCYLADRLSKHRAALGTAFVLNTPHDRPRLTLVPTDQYARASVRSARLAATRTRDRASTRGGKVLWTRDPIPGGACAATQ